MAQERQRYALQTIFSFFLGIMVTAFIGVGVNTFYPAPDQTYQEELQNLNRKQEDIDALRSGKEGTLTPAEQKQLQQIRDDIRKVEDKRNAQQKVWARNTSIIVILFATIVMALSLIRSEQLKVISNGLLLGGVFTMVYGTGWVIFSGESTSRFFVMVFALAVTVGLGYVKFVRGRQPQVVPAGAAFALDDAAMAGLAARLDSLEARAAAAAAALGAGPDTE
ncbi:MAG: hypothetical protein WC971_08205 [Coriobacteriia bacterium]